MTISFKKSVITSVVIGMSISVTLFFLSWATQSFVFWGLPQAPGFLVSSWVWGMPGFGHDTVHHVQLRRGGFLFPYLMILVNALFYGAIAYFASSICKRSPANFELRASPAGQRPTTDDQRQLL